MSYAFNLDWYELPEELRERKIDEYLLADLDGYKLRIAEVRVDLDPALDLEQTLAEVSDDDVLEELHLREEAEQAIEARFPVYF